jgi:hypothetical protein
LEIDTKIGSTLLPNDSTKDEWNVVQLAGFSIVREILQGYETVPRHLQAQVHVVRETLGDWSSWMPQKSVPSICLSPSFIVTPPKYNHTYRMAIVCPGTGQPTDLAFAIANVVPFWITPLLTAVIPFYRFMRTRFFQSTDTNTAQDLELTFPGPNRLSIYYRFLESVLTQTMMALFLNISCICEKLDQ